MAQKVQFVETVLRDANQSLIATRLPYDKFAPMLETIDNFDARCAEEAIAAIEDSLKAEMLAKNTDVLSGKDYLITWKTIITNRFDSAAFKLTHADLFNQFSRSTTTRRFVIA